jgi:hypothetical protein
MLLYFPSNAKLFLICFSFSEVSFLSCKDLHSHRLRSIRVLFLFFITSVLSLANFFFMILYYRFSCESTIVYWWNGRSCLHQMVWCSVQGPLAWALIVWRCSFVFSSFDKIISVLIHLLPGKHILFVSRVAMESAYGEISLSVSCWRLSIFPHVISFCVVLHSSEDWT